MFRFNFSDLDIEDGGGKPMDGNDEDALDMSKQAQSDNLSGLNHLLDLTKDNDERDEQTSGDKELFKSRELSLDELAQSLPPAFSYSPLVIPLSASRVSADETWQQKTDGRNIILLRRDLFDARYQLISEAGSDADIGEPTTTSEAQTDTSERKLACHTSDAALHFIDNPSDLVPGVYEGGLKTWECSLDLVEYLAKSASGDTGWVRGKRVIEIGCGTAIPSLYLLHCLFSNPRMSSSDRPIPETEFVLQDYNDLVLRFVTFPNVLLQWYASPLTEVYRSQHPSEDENAIDPVATGDLQISTELLVAFRASLQEQHITIRLISGSWQSINHDDTLNFPFDLTLTSETIYQTDSLPSLIGLLKRSSKYDTEKSDKNIVTKTQSLSLEGGQSVCLVAAKVLYFGVGGGVMVFERTVCESRGTVNTVLEKRTGVGRKVMSVQWT